MDKKYVIFTKGDRFFITHINSDNKKMIVYNYMKFLGLEKDSNVVERLCVEATEVTLKEIVEYANSRMYDWQDKIIVIYDLGETIYVA